jgi:hypothetical protein
LPTSDFDEYTNLLDNYENEYDILKKDLAYEPVSMLRKAMVQAYLWGENTVSNIIDNVYWSEDTTETVVDINELISSYHFVLPIIAEVTSATIGAYDENEKPSDDSKAAIDAMVGKYYGYQYYSKAQNRYCYYLRNRSGYTLVLKYTESNHKYNITYKKGDKTYGYKENWSASIEPDCWLDITYMDMPNDPHCYIDTKLSHTESLKVYLRYVIETSNVISGFEENDNQYVLSTSKTNQSSEYDPFLDSDTEYDTALDFDIGMVVTSNSQTAPDVAELRSFGYYGTPVPICKAAWTDELSYWYVESKTTADYGDALAYTKTVKHCYSLGTVIKALLADCAPELSFEETSEYSEFLYGSGVLCSELNSLNSVFRIFFAPMTNVTKEDYDTPAKKCTLSLKVILDMLKNAYQCYPFIENGKLRLEHLIYFVRGHSYKGYSRTLDFVSLRDKFNGRHTIFGQSEVSYSVDSLSSRYEFSWSDEGTDYFNDYALDLKGGITKGLDTEQISISTFSTDVNLMVAFPENFSDDSVALLCVDSNNKVVSRAINVITPEGDSQYIGLQNYYASWLYCVTLYRWYVYPSTNIEVNDNNRIAETSKDVKTADFMQVTINLPRVVTDSITNYQIITDVGTGYVDSATENLDSGFISATLNIEPK